MKKMYLSKIPVKLAPHFAKKTYELGIVNQLSFIKDEFFDGTQIYVYCIVPEEQEAAFVTEFKNYVTVL